MPGKTQQASLVMDFFGPNLDGTFNAKELESAKTALETFAKTLGEISVKQTELLGNVRAINTKANVPNTKAVDAYLEKAATRVVEAERLTQETQKELEASLFPE